MEVISQIDSSITFTSERYITGEMYISNLSAYITKHGTQRPALLGGWMTLI